MPPLAEALKASVPIVAMVQDVPQANRDRNAFQELDHLALFALVSKWVRALDDPARIDDYVDMAFDRRRSGRPGPGRAAAARRRALEPRAGSRQRARAALGHFRSIAPRRPGRGRRGRGPARRSASTRW